MNLMTTLEKVLAEFDKKGFNKPLLVSWGYEECLCGKEECECGKMLKSFVSQALTESLKEFSAAIEIEKKTFPERESDQYDAGFAAALQAIEERKQKYLNE